MPVRIVHADDHPIVREGVAAVVRRAGMEVVAEAQTANQVVEAVTQHRPSILITEVRLGGHDALKSLEVLSAQRPECRVIVFSAYGNPTNIARARALGCHEFLLKRAPTSELVAAINHAAHGDPTPNNSLLMTTKARMRRATKLVPESPLTNRETQVLRHVSMGLKNREIGKSLGISVETVKEHVQNILRKLDVNDRTQAAVWAIRKEFI